MGLHLPGSAFIHPHTPLRDALTAEAAKRVLELTVDRGHYTPVGHVVDEKAIVNGIVALLATGGSTNHTLHLVAIARAAGIVIDWNDFDELSQAVPLVARIYPNGKADVNHFHAAGGVAYLVRDLLQAGPAARRRANRRGRGPEALHARTETHRWKTHLGRWHRNQPRHESAAQPQGTLRARWRSAPDAGKARPRRDQDLGGGRSASAW